MSTIIDECERRLRHGVPLRLDQVTDLMQEGIDASMVEQAVDCGCEFVDCGCSAEEHND